jgi:FKBP-type peptidyl-prolyl cis-trans isomerase FkpA
MRKQLFLLVCIFLCKITFAQTTVDYTIGKDGMSYKIITDGKGDFLKLGEYIELHFTSFLSRNGKDSMLNNTRDIGMPNILLFDSMQMPINYFEIFRKVKSGDSISTKTLVDELYERKPEAMPNFFRQGDYINSSIKITKIYKTKAEAEIANKKHSMKSEEIAKIKADALVAVNDSILREFILKNNVTALKSPKGTYVQILEEGIGSKLNNKQFVKINYTGKTLDGRMFDSNTDSSKGHVEPLLVNLTEDMSLGSGVIQGMADALLMMKQGTKAIMYIPSGLAYGPRGAGEDIPPNANLIFEVELLNTLSIAQMKAENVGRQKKMAALQKKYQDSAYKANKPVTLGNKKNSKAPIKNNLPIKASALKKTIKKK